MTTAKPKSGYSAFEEICSGREMERRRRPYLRAEIREQLGSVSRSHLLRYFRPGELLHVDMDGEEISWIMKSCITATAKHRAVPWEDIASALPGRTVEDLKAFHEDYMKHGEKIQKRARKCIIVGEDSECMTRMPVIEQVRTRKTSRSQFSLERELLGRQESRSVTGGYLEVASWAGCSGTVIQIATPSTTASLSPSGLYTCLVGSATETDPSRQRPGLQDPYNRPGELVGLRLDGHGLSCQVIDGHRTVHPGDGRVMRSTVSCVVHSDNNSAYVTGGFDGNIAVWSDDKLSLLARFGNHGCPINAIGTDSKTYGVLYGTSKGELIWCADPLGSSDGKPALHTLSGPQVVPGQNLPLANSLDVLLMTGNLRTKTKAYAGYGYLTGNKSGAVHVYDLGAMQAGDVYKLDHERALTDIALHPEEHLLAVASGILFDDKSMPGDGIVKLYDVRSPNTSQSITTRQTDIHRISFSPCGDLLYSNDASTGLMLVHDIRYASRPIWSHSHSASNADDHYLCFAWMPNTIAGIPSGLLWTGGNDSKLKLWDLRRPEPLIEQHDLGQPINNAVVSTDGALVWAGTEFGSIHLLAKNNSLTETVGRNIKVSYDTPTV